MRKGSERNSIPADIEACVKEDSLGTGQWMVQIDRTVLDNKSVFLAVGSLYSARSH